MVCSKTICVSHCGVKDALCEVAKAPVGILKFRPGEYTFPAGTVKASDRLILRGKSQFEPRSTIAIGSFQGDSKTFITALINPLDFIRLEGAGILPVFQGEAFAHTPFVNVSGTQVSVETGQPISILKVDGDLEIFQELVLEHIRLEVTGTLRLRGNLTLNESSVIAAHLDQQSGRLEIRRSRVHAERITFKGEQRFRLSYIFSVTAPEVNFSTMEWLQTVIESDQVRMLNSDLEFNNSCGPLLKAENVRARIGSGLFQGNLEVINPNFVFNGFGDEFGNICFDRLLSLGGSIVLRSRTSLGSNSASEVTVELRLTDVFSEAGSQWNFFSTGSPVVRIDLYGGSFVGEVELIDANSAQPSQYNWSVAGSARVSVTSAGIAQFANSTTNPVLLLSGNFPYPAPGSALTSLNDFSVFGVL